MAQNMRRVMQSTTEQVEVENKEDLIQEGVVATNEQDLVQEEVQENYVVEETATALESENFEEEEKPTIEELGEVETPTSSEKLELESLKSQLRDKDEKVNELSEALAKMQAQMEAFMKGAMSMSMGASAKTDDSVEVLVGCRSIYGGALSTSDDRISFKFECDEEKYINSDDLKELFRDSKRNNKRNFENDIFYFVDGKYYDTYKIKKRVDLSPDNIVRILCLPTHDMIDEFNIITNNKNSFWLMHEFQYQVVKLLVRDDSRLSQWTYENRNTLERYIGQKFDALMASVGALELLGRKKYNK